MKILPSLLLFSISVQLSAQTILIDFGKDTQQTSGEWNNFAEDTNYRFPNSNPSPVLMLDDMIDSTGAETLVDLYYVTKSSESASAGIGGADFDVATTIGQPRSATRDTMFINRGSQAASATFELRGLDANGLYDLTFYAGIAAERNATDWTVDGMTVSLNPENNTTQTVTITGAQADASGVLSILWAGNTGTSSNTSAHWNSLQIVAVPEPSATGLFATLAAASAVVLLRRRRA
tara:strand:- start:9433 stop:10137 length:705 start_codon:yes stop_codon:yes gene_type:complete